MIDSDLVLVDSSGWVEYWGNGPKAPSFDPYFDRAERVLLPSIVIYEVFKKLSLSRGGNLAERFLSYAYRTRIVPFDEVLAIASAENSVHHKLAMADAIIFTTATFYGAELVTCDQAFIGLPGVTLI
jgi:predicted nucleic acid-binding protein